VGLHFIYQAIMAASYKLRQDPAWLEVTVWAAKQQVALAPRTAPAMRREFGGAIPAHRGFERLVILADKAGDDAEVIRLCSLAHQQGWNGDWERRLSKAHERIARKARR
jgi:hypothetical protein